MNKLTILASVLIAVASTAESAGLRNQQDTVMLECSSLLRCTGGGDISPLVCEPTTLEVTVVSATPGAPEINAGDQCSSAIGALVNSRFMLLSATSTTSEIFLIKEDSGAFPTTPTSVQYLFVSKPARRGH